MTDSKSDAPKVQALKRHGTLNPHPERIRDPLFVEDAFFDPRDLVQVKYEMLRRVRRDGQSISEVADAFGLSRPVLYKAQAAFAVGGLPGLLPHKRGPKTARKVSDEVLRAIQQALANNRSLRARELTGIVERQCGVRVHVRTVQRALARLEKKS